MEHLASLTEKSAKQGVDGPANGTLIGEGCHSTEMDRAQQLRLLMKQQQLQKSTGQSSGGAGSLLSAKEMVRQVKQQKAQQTPAPTAPAPASNKPKPEKSHSVPPSASTVSTGSKLPSNFFDDEPALPSAPVPAEPVKPKSNIPVGFFDDPMADLTARGVDMNAFAKEVEDKQVAQVSEFLQSIGDVEEDGQDEEVDESIAINQPGDGEDEALQLAYLTKYASLLKQSDGILNPSSTLGLDEMIAETQTLRADVVSSGGIEAAVFEQGVLQTKNRKKRHIYSQVINESLAKRTKQDRTEEDAKDSDEEEEDEDEDGDLPEYSPLDYF